MQDHLFSSTWYRVANLKPRIRGHAQIHRDYYRGELWYVLQDHSSGRFHRFTPGANYVIGLFDGTRSVQEVWELAGEKLGDDMPTQDEIINLLAQLHQADVLLCDVPPDIQELFDRHKKHRKSRIKRNLRSPLALTFPLWDPERFLSRFMPFLRPIFGWAGFLSWAAIVLTALVLASTHWPELTENLSDRVLAANNLLLIGLIFPIVKALHELGHGFATKAWGGEVHEMGIMLLVLMPIPYVDASSAWAFRNKRSRVVVGAAGMMVEMLLAALALFVWINVEPGLVRAVAFNVMLIAGVSTLLFNANPLIRFDGYYILSDFLEIPNLSPRSNRYIGYVIQKYLFATPSATSPVNAPGERGWFIFYGLASFAYRMFIMTVIVLFVAGKYFVIGIILAIWAMYMMILMPLYKQLTFLITSPRLRSKRGRALLVTGAIVGSLVAILVWWPMPHWTRAEGIVRIPEDSVVRVDSGGFVDEVYVESDQVVRKGDLLVRCSDPELRTQAAVLAAKVTELEIRHRSELVQDIVQAEVTSEELQQARAELALTRERLNNLLIRSPRDGLLVINDAQNLAGRFLARGTQLGYVLDRSAVTARVVVSQADVDWVRQSPDGIALRLAERLDRVIQGTFAREIPAATDLLPSLALSSEGGGDIAIDPREPARPKAFQKLFVFDIDVPPEAGVARLGGRVYVRFDHGSEPLARQWYRGLRQLFLRKFNV